MFAVIYIPDFPLEAVLRAEPDLRLCPVAVLEGTPPLLEVIAVNDSARELGLMPGMSRLHAEATPGVTFRRRSAAKEAAAHAALLDAAQSFSPRVEDAAPDTVILDAAGLESLVGPPPEVARGLAERVKAMGLVANTAIASNIEAALHAARGFAGVAVIPPGQERQRVGELPPDVLAASANGHRDADPGETRTFVELLDTLDRWGVRNLRALAALPEVAVAERLGQEGLRLQRLARGEGERTLVPTEAPLQFEEAMELEWPLESLEPLAFLLSRMLEQLCARLQARALATNELRLRLELEPSGDEFRVSGFEFRETNANCRLQNAKSKNEPANSATCNLNSAIYERTIRLPLPMVDAKTFLKLLQLDLQAHPPQAPIAKTWLRAEPVLPRAAQGGLFLPTAPAPERLEITLARIKGIVGEERVGVAEIRDTHRPDGLRMRRFTIEVASRESQVVSKNVVSPPSPVVRESDSKPETRNSKLALRQFRPPISAAVETRDGVPVAVIFGGAKYYVTAASGPWHGSGDWWHEGTWQRDEWDIEVETNDGRAVYRVVADASGGWFVEGNYD